MKLLSGRRPQIRLVGLMLGIAVIGLVLGGVAWFRPAWPEIQARRQYAANHEAMAKYWRRVPSWIDNPLLSARRHPNSDGVHYDGRQPYVYRLHLYWSPEGEAQHESVRRHRAEILALCRDQVAYHERMRDRWSWAAWSPWSDPGFDEPDPPITVGEVVDQSY
jgi:hypothetical protein